MNDIDIIVKLWRAGEKNRLDACYRCAAVSGKQTREIAGRLRVSSDTVERMARAGRMYQIVIMRDEETSATLREKLYYSHFAEVGKYYENGMSYEDALNWLIEACEMSIEQLRAALDPKEGRTYLDTLRSYIKCLRRDLIDTPFLGLTTRDQLDKAADIRAKAMDLAENISLLLQDVELVREVNHEF